MLSDLKLAARYWKRVTKRAAHETWEVARGTWRSVPGKVVSALAAAAVAALGYGVDSSKWGAVLTVLLGAAFLTLAVFVWKVVSVSAKLDAEGTQTIAALRNSAREQAVNEQTLQRLITLHDRGLRMRSGELAAFQGDWSAWRKEVYSALPFDKERFRMACTDTEFATSLRQHRHDLITRQLDQLKQTIARVEEEMRIRQPTRSAE